ncbi:hypothetical protein VCSRO41_0071 [Vibrio cholerae]|nr:hypothetical protein VCSRO157_0477 [Vibrio cholerae]GIA84850.1 hypothetical protein VCSRO41_0071 [Vibrio cholerae]
MNSFSKIISIFILQPLFFLVFLAFVMPYWFFILRRADRLLINNSSKKNSYYINNFHE